MKRWLIWLLILLAAEAVLLANDAALDTWTWRVTRWFMGDQDRYAWADYKAKHVGNPDAPFYQRVDPPMSKTSTDPRRRPVEAQFFRRTESFWRVCRAIGEPWTVVIAIALVWIYDRRAWRAAAIVAGSTALAGGAGMAIRAVTGRLRPDGTLIGALDGSRNDGANLWYFWRGVSGQANDLSFPSGHATAAFALAAALAYLSPRGRGVFFTLAALCALSRVAMGAHFYSDAIMGAGVGIAIGHLTAVVLDQRLAAKSPTLPPVAV